MLWPIPILLAALPLVASPQPARISATATAAASPTASLDETLLRSAPTLHPEALRAALDSYTTLSARGEVTRPLLTVIDYGQSSRSKRLWVFDLAEQRLVHHELVAHGRNSGEDVTRSFSNEDGSYMTSLGAFVTGDSYTGKNGYSMRLRGMDPGRNDHAEARAIVVHGAPYVDEGVGQTLGRLGRSNGCPAVRPSIARELIDGIKGRSLLYAWHPSMLSPPVAAAATREAS